MAGASPGSAVRAPTAAIPHPAGVRAIVAHPARLGQQGRGALRPCPKSGGSRAHDGERSRKRSQSDILPEGEEMVHATRPGGDRERPPFGSGDFGSIGFATSGISEDTSITFISIPSSTGTWPKPRIGPIRPSTVMSGLDGTKRIGVPSSRTTSRVFHARNEPNWWARGRPLRRGAGCA